MINYSETEVGDILEVCGAGAPGYYVIGELVRVKEVSMNGVLVENQNGVDVNFVFNCGAARIKPTEWKKDFPEKELGL